jgi:hypothetical protein
LKNKILCFLVGILLRFEHIEITIKFEINNN